MIKKTQPQCGCVFFVKEGKLGLFFAGWSKLWYNGVFIHTEHP